MLSAGPDPAPLAPPGIVALSGILARHDDGSVSAAPAPRLAPWAVHGLAPIGTGTRVEVWCPVSGVTYYDVHEAPAEVLRRVHVEGRRWPGCALHV